MNKEKLRFWLLDYAKYLESDSANTDEFLQESMTFEECLELMDSVVKAVREYANNIKI